MSSSKSGFKAKLDSFQQRFKSLLGARAQVGWADPWRAREIAVKPTRGLGPPAAGSLRLLALLQGTGRR